MDSRRALARFDKVKSFFFTALARALQGLPEACIAELAARIARTPVHANRVVGFAKEETVVSAGTPLEGLYVLLKGTRPTPPTVLPTARPTVLWGGHSLGLEVLPKGASCAVLRAARRDETCPISTEGGTRRIQLVREGGWRGGARRKTPG